MMDAGPGRRRPGLRDCRAWKPDGYGAVGDAWAHATGVRGRRVTLTGPVCFSRHEGEDRKQ